MCQLAHICMWLMPGPSFVSIKYRNIQIDSNNVLRPPLCSARRPSIIHTYSLQQKRGRYWHPYFTHKEQGLWELSDLPWDHVVKAKLEAWLSPKPFSTPLTRCFAPRTFCCVPSCLEKTKTKGYVARRIKRKRKKSHILVWALLVPK